MSKVQEIKSKVTAAIGAIRSKIFKKSAPAPDSAQPDEPPRPSAGPLKKLGSAYKEGSTTTRLMVVLILAGFGFGIYSLANVAVRLAHNKGLINSLFYKGTVKYDKMEDFLRREAEMKHDIASTVSIDKIRLNSLRANGTHGFLSISLWVKCDAPKTAKFVEETYPRLHDAILTKIQSIQEDQITSEKGKKQLQEQMREAMNSVMPFGKIENVFFYNMIFE